uniref:THAP domain-containing protein 1 n=1 Tax=Monopterus albus TaxID=43700 RepID=A0A3Q3JDG9_MONAL
MGFSSLSCSACRCIWSFRWKFNSAISFHHFLKDETLRKIWIRNVRRDNLVIKRTTTVCSRHFVSTDVIQGGRQRLKEGAVPVLFAWNDYSLPATSTPAAGFKSQHLVTQVQLLVVKLSIQPPLLTKTWWSILYPPMSRKSLWNTL